MERQTQWIPPAPPAPLSEPAVPAAAPRPSYEQKRRPLRDRVFGPLILVGALLLKFGKAGLLLATKAKFLVTSGSMLVSVAAYALIWGWKFAAGFVALLFVHEMGHYIQLRREGVRPSGMVFIPFLGAAVGTRSLGGSALAEARVGLAGPILGSLACLVPATIWLATGEEFWQALAFTGFFLNLFNLRPGAAARRRSRDGGDGPVDVVRRLRRDGRAAVHRAEPDPDPDRAASAASRPTGAGSSASRARRATPPTTRSSPPTGSRSARSTSA